MQFQSSDFALFYLVVWLIGIVLAITWAVFPFLVLSRLNKLVRHAEAIDQNLLALIRAYNRSVGQEGETTLPR